MQNNKYLKSSIKDQRALQEALDLLVKLDQCSGAFKEKTDADTKSFYREAKTVQQEFARKEKEIARHEQTSISRTKSFIKSSGLLK